LSFTIGRLPAIAGPHDYYRALSLAVRDRMQHRWMNTTQTYFDLDRKIACYLSAEFLMGPHLGNNLVNLGLERRRARPWPNSVWISMSSWPARRSRDWATAAWAGSPPAIWIRWRRCNVRRSAMASVTSSASFDQEIHDGWQTEITDKWLRHGNPWEIPSPTVSLLRQLGWPYRTLSGRSRV
jgi:glycogen phosphorylase